MEKLIILTNGAKYDAACTSSGVDRPGKTVAVGCCHAFSADGRCISLLKVLLTNYCIYDCRYCVNRVSNDCPRAAFTPEELAELTIQFYRRNYIEGLFLSSGVVKSPDYTMELMIRVLELLRFQYDFWGYIHAKVIPGASPELVRRMGLLADRISVNVEMPSEQSLHLLCPNKKKEAIFSPMRLFAQQGRAQKALTAGKGAAAPAHAQNAPKFAPAGQATQMIIGATPESDYQIIKLAAAMYQNYDLRRVFYSAHMPVVEDSLLPTPDTKPPLLREHRLYQADFLMRQYGFAADEILSPEAPNFNPYLDPKCNWAIHNMHLFPVDVNTAEYRELLRVPGIGPTSARRIVTARRHGRLGIAELRRMGVVLKRAKYFIRAADWSIGIRMDRQATVRALIDPKIHDFGMEQLSMFQDVHSLRPLPAGGDVKTIPEAVEEAVRCLAASL